MARGMVFVQTNEARNRVVAFARDEDGSLAEVGRYETGGAGNGEPHLPSQGSVILTGDGGHLLVTNVASDEVTLFAVQEDGRPEPIGRAPAGTAPRSVAERDGLVYVLGTGKPMATGFRIDGDGLQPIVGAEYALSGPECDPAQVGFSPDGSALVVTERGTDAIVSFPVHEDGTLGALRTVASSGPTPYGFAFTSAGTMVVTEAFGARKGAAAASTYQVDGAVLTPVTRSVGNGRSEICWAVVTPDDRYAYTTNFADGAVSCFALADDGSLTLQDAAAGVSVDGRPGLRDECLAAGGRFLYALDADSGSVFGWAVEEDGHLTPLGSWDGLPPTVAGLAAT
jgi:6-phosphogluconolactonase